MQSELKKILENSFNTLHGMVRQAHHDDAGQPGRFVFQQVGRQRQPGSADSEAEDNGAVDVEQKKENEVLRQRTEYLQLQANNANISEPAKERIKQLLQRSMRPLSEEEESTAFGYQNRVAEFLEGPITADKEAEFLEGVRRMEGEDRLWGQIFNIQRGIRKKIRDLQYHTESYVEITKAPKKKLEFKKLLEKVRTLNKLDDDTDRGLKRTLYSLTQRPAHALGNGAVKEIYNENPAMSDNLKAVMNKHRSAIEMPGDAGRTAFRTLLALKKDEARIEIRMGILCDELKAIIDKNVREVSKKVTKQKILDDCSKTVGITLKEGTVIEYDHPDHPSLLGNRETGRIQRITFNDHNIRGKSGELIDVDVGMPLIHMESGAKLPFGRFKKWVDATDATERINSIEEVERAAEFAAYGIKLEEGMTLSYPHRHRKAEGSPVETTMVNVTVKEINSTTKRIRFDQPVLFSPGYPTGKDYDFRESLTFGEFVKWKHRYEVEKSVSLEETRQLLKRYNELENKFYGKPAEDNLPIEIKEFEELQYPDELNSKYIIVAQDAESVTVDAFGKMSYPEFFYWVKNNHVRKTPKQNSPAQQSAEKEQKEAMKDANIHEKDLRKTKEHAGEEQQKRAHMDAEKRAAGSVADTVLDVWHTTTFLSMKDLWNMGKEVLEFMKRKHERRSKGRYSLVGSRLPWVVGTEFERVKQAAENEEAGKYKEAMEHWSIEKVKKTLHNTTSKDEAKACMQVLVHKGELRWDDHHMWDTLNKLTARYTLKGAELYIPKPENMPPGESGENKAIKAIDALFGEGTGNEWFVENTGKFNSIKKNFEYEFKQLENDPKGTGGPAGELFNMLQDWRKGEYVNPQKYEAMIDGAIVRGKMNAEQKMFYIIAGVITRQGDDPAHGKHNPGGETLLHIDRVAELNSLYCPQFPMLDFFTQEEIPDYSLIDEKTGKYGKMRKFNFSDYEKWAHMYFWDDYKEGKPGPQFSAFMWEKALVADATRVRISKGMRNAEGMDHDDMHLYVPPLSINEIDSLLAPQSGNKKYLTNEGYMNAYPGYNQQIICLSYAIENAANDDDKKKRVAGLRDLLNGFVRYDATLDYRWAKNEGNKLARLDQHHYEKPPVVDSCAVKVHQNQLRHLILEIGKAYGQDWDQWLYAPKTGSMLDKKEKEKQLAYERKLDNMRTLIPELLAQDDGGKALAVIKEMRTRGELSTKKGGTEDPNALRGIPKSRRPRPEKYKEMLEAGRKWEVDHAQHSAHGGGH